MALGVSLALASQTCTAGTAAFALADPKTSGMGGASQHSAIGTRSTTHLISLLHIVVALRCQTLQVVEAKDGNGFVWYNEAIGTRVGNSPAFSPTGQTAWRP